MRHILLGGLLAAALGGCASHRTPNDGWPRMEAITPSMVGGTPLREYQVDVVALMRQAICESADKPAGCAVAADAGTPYGEYAAYLTLGDEVGSEAVRNTVVSQVVAASVHNCHIYLQSLRGGQVAARTGTDLVTSTMSVAGAALEPLSTSRALSSLAALSTSYGATWDRNVYADQAAEMIADELRKLRLTEREALESKYALPYAEWPMAVAMADVAEFHHSCTMLRGISLIQDAVVNRERSVRAVRIAATEARDAGGGPDAVVAAVSGVARAFLGTSDFDRGLTALAPGLTIGSRDLEAAIASGRACLADLIVDGRRKEIEIATVTACQMSADHPWRDQFIAVVVQTANDPATTAETFRARAAEGLNDRRAAIEAGRTLYSGSLARSVGLGWSWEMIERTLQSLTSPHEDDEAVAYGPEMMGRDPVILALRRSYDGFLQDSGDREFALRGAVAVAQMLASNPGQAPENDQQAPAGDPNAAGSGRTDENAPGGVVTEPPDGETPPSENVRL